jgi:hypothetical protein
MSQIIRERSAPLQRFTGGLNNYWDQSSIDDSELASVINFEFTSNGALTSRPPIYLEKNSSNVVTKTPVASEPLDIIGTYIRQDGVRFLVGVTDDKTWIYNVTAKTWTQIATFRASDCTQYLNKIVLCSETQAGGYWEAGTFTSTPTMPYLGGIELFQTRFFGFGVQGTPTANIVYWSNISTAGPSGVSTSVFDWEDEFDAKLYVEIGGGDGQWITAMAQGYNDIVIFRNRSTYRYSYGELPEEGTMQVMQQDIGAETRRSVVKFENAHLVLSGQTLYLYQNYLYYPLNSEKVRFTPDNTYERRFEHAISMVGSRCIVFHNGGIYCYDMDTRTWSQWTTASRIGYFVTIPRRFEDEQEELYYGISGSAEVDAPGITDYSVYRIEDDPTSSIGSEEMTCSLRTKIYDFQTPVEWKRLYFWTADITTARIVRAVAVPVAIREKPLAVHWDELSSDGQYDNSFYTWDELSQENEFDDRFGTWDRLKTPGTIETVIEDFPQGQLIRMETKLDNSLRFRRIYFELYLSCDGTAATSPVQVFSIIPMVGAKAKIAREAN